MLLTVNCYVLLELTLNLSYTLSCLGLLPLKVILARTNQENETRCLTKRYPLDLYFMQVVLNGFIKMR